MARVHLSRRALRDIDEIDRFSTERWGDRVAGRYLDDLDAALQRLQESPTLLREKSETSLRLSFYRVREHFLVCDLVGEHVHVLAVIHGSMDLPQRIADLEPHLVHEARLLHDRLMRNEDLDPGIEKA